MSPESRTEVKGEAGGQPIGLSQASGPRPALAWRRENTFLEGKVKYDVPTWGALEKMGLS